MLLLINPNGSTYNFKTLPDNKGKVAYLTNADKLKFLKKIIKDDRMHIFTELLSFKMRHVFNERLRNNR